MDFNTATVDTLYSLSLYTKPVGATALAREMGIPYRATVQRLRRLVEAENVENIEGKNSITEKGRLVLSLLLEIREVNAHFQTQKPGFCSVETPRNVAFNCR